MNCCLDCNKRVSPLAKRCKSCARKHSYKDITTHPMFGKNHSRMSRFKISRTVKKINLNVVHGLTRKKYYCLDCNIKISDYRCKRCNSCSQKKRYFNIKNHPSYIDGRSYEKYPREFNVKLRLSIRNRDSFQCQNKDCLITEKEHKLKYKRALHIHHIDYNRKNCKGSNLITLCQACNIKANYNREYWEEYYQLIIIKKWGMKYGKTRDINNFRAGFGLCNSILC